MKFELKLDMYNADQEAVWLNDFLHEHDLEDMETHVKEAPPEPGTLDGGILLPALVGIASGIISVRIEWLISKIWQHFAGKKGTIEFSATCPDNGQSFNLSFELGSEKERDEAQAEFKRRYETFCKSPAD
jgi:hypothetical protein